MFKKCAIRSFKRSVSFRANFSGDLKFYFGMMEIYNVPRHSRLLLMRSSHSDYWRTYVWSEVNAKKNIFIIFIIFICVLT